MPFRDDCRGDGEASGRTGPEAPRLIRTRDVGIYVHVPFCRSRCDFCAFAVWLDSGLDTRYLDAVVSHAKTVARGESRPVSVYFGGGTPSLVAPKHLGRILDAISPCSEAEVSLELHPEDALPKRLSNWKRVGVTRVSLGVQSTRQHVLEALGRNCGAEETLAALGSVAEAGFSSWNVDLIYGSPAETDADWEAVLEEVLAFHPPHLSCYALSVERGARIYANPDRHPREEALRRRYELAEAMADAEGLVWYELSNWAKPGHICKHNLLYWTGGNWLGLGAGAWSAVGELRWRNLASPRAYIEAAERGEFRRAELASLDAEQLRCERVMLNLRTRWGADQKDCDQEGLAICLEEGLVDLVDGRVVLSLAGRHVANEATRLLVG